jgi:hypothetical protein
MDRPTKIGNQRGGQLARCLSEKLAMKAEPREKELRGKGRSQKRVWNEDTERQEVLDTT